VILDILLPGMRGWEVLAQLKGDPATAAIPVVIASMIDDRGIGFALGAAEYLVKPVHREELLEALGRCVAPLREGRTVVVIDDERVDLDLIEAVLVPEGWSVVRASGGEEGVQLVRRERPAVVLLDLLMPDVDGFEVIDALHVDPRTAAIPVVVLTAKALTAQDRRRLQGRIEFVASKGELDLSWLADRLTQVAATGAVGEAWS
jgi:CheY-like chemotaxis protein